jgi:ring-1,2-phenylacetyl-CoA epoxidase subunit PaaA
MLIDLGITLTEDDFERGPHPLYIFDMRDAATTWVEWCWFFFFADRNGIYQARQWIDCSYRPLAATAARQAADEVRHAALGVKGLTQLCATAEGKAAAQETLHQWYPAGLDMFGRSDTARQYRYIELGLKRSPNDQLRDEFRQECDVALRKLGLQPPDPAANRRYC